MSLERTNAWTAFSAIVQGVRHEARYREAGSYVEVEWTSLRRIQPRGSVRVEVAATVILKQMLRKASAP